MIRNGAKATSMADVQAKIATLQRLDLEYSKGINEREDTDAKALAGLVEVTSVRYFDVLKKPNLLKILSDNVVKGLHKYPSITLETTSYGELLKTGTQLVKHRNTNPTAMDLDALEEDLKKEDRETHQTKKLNHTIDESEKNNEDTMMTLYGQDGFLYYSSPKSKGTGQETGGDWMSLARFRKSIEDRRIVANNIPLIEDRRIVANNLRSIEDCSG